MFLQLKDIHKSYGEKDYKTKVLKGISLEVEKGEFVVLLGPSGSGKSTLLNIIGGIDTCDEGEILIDGEPLKRMNEKRLVMYRRENLGYIFQMYNLIPDLTVRENIETGAYLSRHPLDVDELIKVLGLEGHADKLPAQLSGGQQQRTSIGRAIVKNPPILLCDEPTGALDYATSKLNEDFENAKIEESELIYLNEEILACLKLYQTDIALRETLKKLSAGAGELQNGLDQIAQGADTLTSNNDSIKEGLDELVDAAKEFDDGMNEFVNEDLDDILKLGGSSLKNIADRIKALKKIDGNYGCFSGLKEGKSGKSVFIIETDAIGE